MVRKKVNRSLGSTGDSDTGGKEARPQNCGGAPTVAGGLRKKKT